MNQVFKEDEFVEKVDQRNEQIKKYEKQFKKYKNQDLDKIKEDTRSKIAHRLIGIYCLIFVLLIVFIPLNNFIAIAYLNNESLILDLKDTVATIISLMNTVLGFVLGYYFASEKN